MSGWGNKELEISLREHRPVYLIYMDRQGAITQRMVQVTKITEEGVQGYCYTRREPRTFSREQILAVSLQASPATRSYARMRRYG